MPSAPEQPSLVQLETLAERLRALGHPVRLAIVYHLGARGPTNVTAIHTALEVEQATASHHLRILRTAGLVTVERAGKSSVYTLADPNVADVLKQLE